MGLLEILVALIFFAIALVPITMVVALMLFGSRSATRTVGECWRCRYDLRGLERDCRNCPECGHPFAIDHNGDQVSKAATRAPL